jgi:hypothetical protein
MMQSGCGQLMVSKLIVARSSSMIRVAHEADIDDILGLFNVAD